MTARPETPDDPSNLHGSSACEKVDTSDPLSTLPASAMTQALERLCQQCCGARMVQLAKIGCCPPVLNMLPCSDWTAAHPSSAWSAHSQAPRSVLIRHGDASACCQCGGPGCSFSAWSTATGAGLQAPGPVAALQHKTVLQYITKPQPHQHDAAGSPKNIKNGTWHNGTGMAHSSVHTPALALPRWQAVSLLCGISTSQADHQC